MKRKEFLKEIGNLDSSALKARASQLAEELMRLRFKKATRQLENSHRIKETRRSLAVVSTFITRSKAPSIDASKETAKKA